MARKPVNRKEMILPQATDSTKLNNYGLIELWDDIRRTVSEAPKANFDIRISVLMSLLVAAMDAEDTPSLRLALLESAMAGDTVDLAVQLKDRYKL